MLQEVRSAVNFVTNILQKGNIDVGTVETFKQALYNFLCIHYQNHWFPEKPNKGSAYRCLRIVNKKMDPLILRAGNHCGISELQLMRLFPSELTVWVDPNEVSYRIGEDGSIGVLFEEDNRESSSPEVPATAPQTSYLHQMYMYQNLRSMYFNNQGHDSVPLECMAS